MRHYLPFIVLFLAVKTICTITYAQGVTPDSLLASANKSLLADDYAAAISQYRVYLAAVQKQKDWLKTGNAYNGMGIAYNHSGDYENALSNYFEAHHYFELNKNEKRQAGTLKNIGNTYCIIKSYDKSAAFLQQALAKYTGVADSTGISGVLNDIGILYMMQDSNYLAITYFKNVIHHYNKYVKDEVKAYALNNLGITYSKIKKYNQALTNYQLALEVMKKLDNDYGLALILINMSDLYNKWCACKTALDYNQQAMAIAEKLHSKELLAGVFENSATYYSQQHDFAQAYTYLKKQMDLKDSVFKEESAKSYAQMETRYQNEKKQKEIVQLQQESIIRKIELANQQRAKYLLIITVVLISLVAILLYRTYIIKQRSNQELNQLNNQLNEANASKTKLFSIISHDLRSPVSNLFSFLQLQKRNPGRLSPDQQEAHNKEISNAAENLLEAMEDLLIWSKSQMDKFTPSDEEVNISEVLDEIIRLNTTAAQRKNIQLTKECSDILMLHTDPNFLKIILRNLTGNAIKFTPPDGFIHLQAETKPESLMLTVRDSGQGIRPADLQTIFEWNSIRSDSSGLGLKLAKEFTERLKGSILVESQLNQGTAFILSFPLH